MKPKLLGSKTIEKMYPSMAPDGDRQIANKRKLRVERDPRRRRRHRVLEVKQVAAFALPCLVYTLLSVSLPRIRLNGLDCSIIMPSLSLSSSLVFGFMAVS